MGTKNGPGRQTDTPIDSHALFTFRFSSSLLAHSLTLFSSLSTSLPPPSTLFCLPHIPNTHTQFTLLFQSNSHYHESPCKNCLPPSDPRRYTPLHQVPLSLSSLPCPYSLAPCSPFQGTFHQKNQLVKQSILLLRIT